MSANLTKHADCITLVISDDLGFCVWQVVRDARIAAAQAGLTLRIDVSQCSHGDMSGIGSLLLAQEKLKSVELTGCTQKFAEVFSAYGICKQCASDRTHCPEGKAQT